MSVDIGPAPFFCLYCSAAGPRAEVSIGYAVISRRFPLKGGRDANRPAAKRRGPAQRRKMEMMKMKMKMKRMSFQVRAA